jgi:hypothetical protein
MRHFDEFAMPLAMEGEIRRYFDYNYLANALPIIGEVARAAGTWGETIPSKYGLQLLYDARETGSMSDGHRIDRMSRWKGTGRYKQDTRHYFSGLGSPTSQSSIIEELIKAHYLQRTGPKRHHTELTEEGNRFLDLLHPDCEDRDLPFRLDQWSRMPVDEAQEKINRYIRTFFGKQKVFLDKTRASEAAA